MTTVNVAMQIHATIRQTRYEMEYGRQKIYEKKKKQKLNSKCKSKMFENKI